MDGVSVGAVTGYTFNAITANHTIAATFDTGYLISASAGPGGTISPSGDIAVATGASQSFVITPGAGARVQDVRVDGVSVGPVTGYTFSSIAANHTIAATFEVLLSQRIDARSPGSAISCANPKVRIPVLLQLPAPSAIAGFSVGHRFATSLILALRDKGTKNLTIVANSLGDAGATRGQILAENNQVKKIVVAFSVRPGTPTARAEGNVWMRPPAAAGQQPGAPDVVIIGTGSEVPLCVSAREKLAAVASAIASARFPSFD